MILQKFEVADGYPAMQGLHLTLRRVLPDDALLSHIRTLARRARRSMSSSRVNVEVEPCQLHGGLAAFKVSIVVSDVRVRNVDPDVFLAVQGAFETIGELAQTS